MQSCVAFDGDSAGLRAWVASSGLKPLPPPGQAAFLGGAKGVAYDATNAAGKFVLIFTSDGACSVVADRADWRALIVSLEQDLRDAGITFSVAEHADARARGVAHRDYAAAKGARHWRLAISAAPADPGVHPVLSAVRG